METIWSVLPSLLWFVFAVIALILLRRAIMQVVEVLLWRLRMGSAIKVASFEIGQAIAMDDDFTAGGYGSISSVGMDENKRRYNQYEAYYLKNRDLQLVHRVAPSKDLKYAYDALIYLIPHGTTNATLASVKKVEYYCGRGWGGRIFTVTDRARSFQLLVSTRGPFICTAEIHFTDGEIVTIGRYIDGEMLGVTPMADGNK